jgi:RNA recognition motif-containing protein
MKKMYVGGLPWSYTDEQLAELFTPFGEVSSARIVTDRDTGRSRGFGFVEMEDALADAAISALHNTEVGGRTITVSEARPQEEGGNKSRSGGFGGGRGGFGGGRGGNRGGYGGGRGGDRDSHGGGYQSF